MTSESLRLEAVYKSYGDLRVVRGVSLTLHPGEIGCLLGPSGCGKTTLLRTVAGFEKCDSGDVFINGQRVSGDAYRPPEKRRIGMVFQDYALFPHMTVSENVRFGLTDRRSLQASERVTSLLRVAELEAEADRYPHELSGGQQQRVALIRALAPKPALLLLDEPFSNLDGVLKESISIEVRALLKELGTTVLMVTHNQQEAFSMGDKVGLLSCGELQQWDTPYALYHRPANTAVAGFVGEGRLIRGRCLTEGRVETALGILSGALVGQCRPEEEVSVLIRPEDVVFSESDGVPGTVAIQAFRGASCLYTVRLENGEEVQALVPSHLNYPVGSKVVCRQRVEDLVIFPSGSDFAPVDQCDM